MIILIDIDHTISNSFWRDSMLGVESWDTYHEASQYDKPFRNMVSLINSLSEAGNNIVAITGRNEKFRQLTLNWFIKHRIDIDELLMRPNDVFLKNADMKLKLVEDHFKGNYKDISFLIDDNEETILTFFKLGITTLHIRNINEGENGKTIS